MLKIIYIKDFKADQPFVIITGSKEAFLNAANFLKNQQGCFLNHEAITEYYDIRELNDGSLYLTATECRNIAQQFESIITEETPRHLYFDSEALPNTEILISYNEM